ncbi:MAG: TonB-dependent receptor [Chitinophagales bacterium]|nr:TonB-dependent receptor [Chitinophagales bacterium]
MKKFYLITLLLMVCSFGAFAQETIIYGVVRDPDANEKIPGASISLGDTAMQVTDEDGKYRLSVQPGQHKVIVSFMGYQTEVKNINIKLGDIKQVNVNLIRSRNEMDVVVVTASQYEKKLSQETVSMDVLSKDLIKNTNSRDLGEALGKTPGVTIQDGQISIRGGSSYSYGVGTRTAVMVDGQGFTSADLGEAQLKMAPVENAAQVEVIKGASSVVYGSSALNGVVNVITAWPKGDKPETDVTFYAGAYTKPPLDTLRWWNARQPGYMGVFLNHKQKVKNFQYVLGGNIDMVQSYLQEADEYRGRVEFKTRYILKKRPNINFGVNALMMKETSGRFFLGQDLDSNAYRIQEGSEDRYVRTTVDPHFTFYNDNGHRFEFRFRYLNVWRRGNGDDINASSNNFDFQNKYQYSWKKHLVITTGLPFAFGRSKSNLYTGLRLNYNGAAYVQVDGIYKDLIVNFGVRYEINSVDTIFETTIPVFRTGLSYKAGKASFFRFSWGQGYRLPSIAERFISNEFVSGLVWIVPTPDLVAEKSWNAEFGFKQGFGVRNWNALFDVALFWQEYKDFVEYQVGTHPNYFDGDTNKIFPDQGPTVFGMKPYNIENARIVGFETSIVSRGNIGDWTITSMIGYTYTYPGKLEDSTDRSIGEFFSDAFKYFAKRVPNSDTANILLFRSRHLMRGDLEIGYKNFAVGATVYYNGFPEKIPELIKFAASTIGGGPESYRRYVEDHIGDFYMDMRASYKFTDKVKFSLICKNLTNAFYYQRPGKVEPPRNITLQLSIVL